MPAVLLTSTLVLCAACAPVAAGAGGQASAPALGASFTLKEKQSVVIGPEKVRLKTKWAQLEAVVGSEKVRVTFERVVSESRCPVDVQCIQAGEATIALVVQAPGGDKTALTLSTRGDQSTGTAGAWDVALTGLVPVPRVKAPAKREPYEATLVVTAHSGR